MSRVFKALRLSLTRKTQGQQRAISQDDLAKTRQFDSNPLRINELGNMARMAPGKMDANAPLKWSGEIKFAGIGGFFPSSLGPLVAFIFALLGKFIYENVYGQDQYDGQIADMKKEHNMNLYADTVKKIMAIKESNPGNIAIASFDEAAFNGMSEADQARLLKVMASGIGNPGSEMGCYAMGPTDYDDFYDFFKKALGRYHKVNLDEKKHSNDWELKGKEGLPADGVLDVAAFGIKEPLSMRIRTARNLKKFPLAGAMSEEDRKNMELAMGPVFDALIANPEFGGSYNSLTPGHKCHISEEKYQELVKAHIMFKDMSADSFLVDAGIASHWPQGRGCYVSEDKGFIIWVGEEDHLRIMAMKKSFKINDVFDRLKAAIDKVEDLIPGGCAKSKDFGVITSCPTNMGTGMRASVHIKIPNLTKGGSDEKAIAILKPYGLGVRGLGGEHTPIGADGTVDISPKARFCISEAEIAIALYKGVEKVMQEESKA